MADQVTRRFERFRNRFLEQGYADPREELNGLAGDERAELALLIEHFLIELPPRAWNEAEFQRSGAAEITERVVDRLAGDPAGDAERLKDLRDRAKIARASLVERLAAALALSSESKRVEFYYHHMEQGTLPLDGVSAWVFAALADVLQVGEDRLRRAAERSQREPGPGEQVFTRAVTGTRPNLDAAESEELQPALPGEPGEADRLFTEG